MQSSGKYFVKLTAPAWKQDKCKLSTKKNVLKHQHTNPLSANNAIQITQTNICCERILWSKICISNYFEGQTFGGAINFLSDFDKVSPGLEVGRRTKGGIALLRIHLSSFVLLTIWHWEKILLGLTIAIQPVSKKLQFKKSFVSRSFTSAHLNFAR